MDIVLISINNSKRIFFNSSIGMGVIHEYLTNRGYKPESINYFVDLSHEGFFIEYSGYVPELINCPSVLKIIRNFKQGKTDLLKDVSGLKRIQLRNLRNLKTAISKMEIKDGSIFGFSVLSVSFLYSIYCALLIRKINPSVKIVFGNYHISLSPNVRDLVLKAGIADVAVIGDGCEPMLKIIQGEISSGVVQGEFKKDVSWPLKYYSSLEYTTNNYMTMTSVGCPFECHFCASKREYVLYDLDKFEKYLQELTRRANVQSIHLVDDEINASIQRAIDICKIMKRIGKAWSCFLTPQNIDQELAKQLKTSNCTRAFVGTDSFNDDRLKYINKPTTEALNLQAIQLLAGQGLNITVSTILGFPYESRQERNYNIDIYKQIKKRYGSQIYACFSMFKLYPGSHFYNKADECGIKFTYWSRKVQEIVPELADIVGATPERFYVPKTNRNAAIRAIKKINNYIPKAQLNVNFKEVRTMAEEQE